jgi:hypothetical protein
MNNQVKAETIENTEAIKSMIDKYKSCHKRRLPRE